MYLLGIIVIGAAFALALFGIGCTLFSNGRRVIAALRGDFPWQ